MDAPGFDEYVQEVERLLRRARDEAPRIAEAASLIVATIAGGRVLYVFGASHAGILAPSEDIARRPGQEHLLG